MDTDDRLRRLTNQLEADRAAVARLPRPAAAVNPPLVVKVLNGGSMPTSLPGQFLTVLNHFEDDVTEGDPVTAVADTGRTVVTTVIGTHAPAVGDLLVAHRYGGRWWADRRAAGAPNPCHCTIPHTLIWNQFNFEGVYATWTLTYGGLPSGLGPVAVVGPGLLGPFHEFNLPVPSWYSEPYVYSDDYGTYTGWKWAWLSGCVMGSATLFLLTSGPEAGKAWVDQTGSAFFTCTPFKTEHMGYLHAVGSGEYTFQDLLYYLDGDHGDDDVVPDSHGNAGT
jgi:hypothetical protein